MLHLINKAYFLEPKINVSQVSGTWREVGDGSMAVSNCERFTIIAYGVII
jgi:hypothetical protein